MGKLRPTSSNTKLEPAPSWDAEPTSPPPATATTEPPPPDSVATDPLQTDSASSKPQEKTLTSPPASPKTTVPSPSVTFDVEQQPSAPPLHKFDEIEPVQAVVFPPAPPVVTATELDNQIVPYVPIGSNSTEQETGQNGHGFGPGTAATKPYGVPGAHVNSQAATAEPTVMFPPQQAGHHVPLPFSNNESVPAHDNNTVPAAAASVARSTGLQPGGPPVILIPFVGVPWRSGLFNCCQHPTNAIITTVAPCVTFGQIAEILDNGSTSCLTGSFMYFFLFLVICHWNIGVRYRRRLRKAFQIAETPLTDRLSHIYCPLCSLCQEFRELKYRGLDPFQGYQGVIAGILHEQRQGVDTIPPVGQAMTR